MNRAHRAGQPAAPRALLIHNPAAGRARRRQALERAAGFLRAAGWQIEFAATEPAGGAAPAARRGIQEQFDVLIACGGDGTLGQVAAEVACAAAEPARIAPAAGASGAGGPCAPAIGLLPCGTANVFARDLQVPLGLMAATRALVGARRRAVPMGRARFADGRLEHFICFASCGFDAHIIHTVTREAKRRFGVAAFIGEALRQLPRYGFPELTGTVRGNAACANTPLRGWGGAPVRLALCTLTRHYAGPFALYPKRMAGRPYLLLSAGKAPALFAQLGFFVASAIRHAPGISMQPVEGVWIEGRAPVQLDGEASGFAPLAIETIPAAVEMLVPAGRAS